MSIVYLNGEYKPLAEAQVSVLDRGFLFGDGVYEVVPVYGRRPFRLQEHLQRLDASLNAIHLPNPNSHSVWASIVERLIADAEFADQQVYLQVTRGATRGTSPLRSHAFPIESRPTVFGMSEELKSPAPELLRDGVSAVSADDIRWLRCDIKSTSLLANCMLRQLAVDAGCAETVMFRNGLLTEGAAANIFVVREGVLLAPPKSQLMLPGITYDVILEIAARQKLPCQIREISAAEVHSADELLMTSSTREVLPIVILDGKPIANGKPGPISLQLVAWYQDFKRSTMYGRD